MEKIVLCWSGGKDSAFALFTLKQQNLYTVDSLLTTVTAGYDRISMHGVRTELLEKQAASLGIPLKKIFISQQSSMEEYESVMGQTMNAYRERGINTVAFGDLFLEDIRKYREDNLAKQNMTAYFPLWKKDTRELAEEFIAGGFKAILACVDTNSLNGVFAGREYDRALLRDLPGDVDVCGENGEFHTFVYDGPVFREPLAIKRGAVTLRDERFSYCDILPE